MNKVSNFVLNVVYFILCTESSSNNTEYVYALWREVMGQANVVVYNSPSPIEETASEPGKTQSCFMQI